MSNLIKKVEELKKLRAASIRDPLDTRASGIWSHDLHAAAPEILDALSLVQKGDAMVLDVIIKHLIRIGEYDKDSMGIRALGRMRELAAKMGAGE